MKYNTDGELQWEITYNGLENQDDEAKDICIDGDGDIIVVGQSGTGDEFKYLTVKYTQIDVIIPRDDEELSKSLDFIENRGQLLNTSWSTTPTIEYYSQSTYPELFFLDDQLSFVQNVFIDSTEKYEYYRIDMEFIEANSELKIRPFDQKDFYYNYELGQIPDVRERVSTFKRLIYSEIYSDIDIMYSSNNRGIKYYYIIKPGGDIKDIHMSFTGADSISIGNDDELIIYTPLGEIIWPQAKAYQIDANGDKVNLAWQPEYDLNGSHLYFTYGSYNSSLALVFQIDNGIDNTCNSDRSLTHSTYWGSSHSDQFRDVTTDASGNIFITGFSYSTTFPYVTGQITESNNNPDAIIIKMDQDYEPKWGTYYGGGTANDENSEGTDISNCIGINSSGKVFIAGYSRSSNLLCLDPGGSAYNDDILNGGTDIFIAKFDEFGFQQWGTFYGGSGNDYYIEANDLTFDSDDNLYVVGRRDDSFETYTQTGAMNETNGSCFILKFANNLERLWATTFGGNGGAEAIRGITTDANNNLYITGYTTASTGFKLLNPTGSSDYYDDVLNGYWDAFVARLDNNNALSWSTYFGGDGVDYGNGIALDSYGNIFITGETRSETGFPVLNPPSYDLGIYHGPSAPYYESYGDAFVAKFSSSYAQLVTIMYGGSYGDYGEDIIVDNANRVFITGWTESGDFPDLNSNPGDLWSQNSLSNYSDGNDDAFITTFELTLNPQWSSFYGGGSGVDGWDGGYGLNNYQNNIYMVGTTGSKTPKIPLADVGGNAYYQSNLGGTGWSFDGFFASFDTSPLLTIGIAENAETNNNFKIFPNPTSNYVNILVNPISKSDVKIKIFDITGNCVYEEVYANILGEKEIQVDFSSYSKSVYLIQISSNGQCFSKKVVLQ